MLHEPDAIARRAVELAATGEYHSVCVHGDGPTAVRAAHAVRDALSRGRLRAAGVRVRLLPCGPHALLAEVGSTTEALGAVRRRTRGRGAAAEEIVPAARTVLFDGVRGPSRRCARSCAGCP